MFDIIKPHGIYIILAGAIAIYFIIGAQNREIANLQQETAEQKATINSQNNTISQQQQANASLTESLEVEREAVRTHAITVKHLQRQADETQSNMQKMLKDTPCAHSHLPSNVIEQLRK